MMRLRYPAVVDGAYAASAPMKFYAQRVEQHAYYAVVTRSAEAARAGCAAAVAAALELVAAADVATLVTRLGLCAPLRSFSVEELEVIACTEFAEKRLSEPDRKYLQTLAFPPHTKDVEAGATNADWIPCAASANDFVVAANAAPPLHRGLSYISEPERTPARHDAVERLEDDVGW